jgi:hypothetical protein
VRLAGLDHQLVTSRRGTHAADPRGTDLGAGVEDALLASKRVARGGKQGDSAASIINR